MAIGYDGVNLTANESPQARLEGAIIEVRKELLDLTQRYQQLQQELRQVRADRDALCAETAARLSEAVQVSRNNPMPGTAPFPGEDPY